MALERALAIFIIVIRVVCVCHTLYICNITSCTRIIKIIITIMYDGVRRDRRVDRSSPYITKRMKYIIILVLSI